MSSLLHEINNETLDLSFSKYNIVVPENYTFSDINIVVGANGSGKTRFLNAIKEIYSSNQNINIIYGYFPSLSDRRVMLNEGNLELPENTIYDSIYLDEISFLDFFKEIELQNEKFLKELLDFQSQRQKTLGENVLKVLHDVFFDLTEKEIMVENKKIYIKEKSGNTKTFSDAISLFSPGELMLLYMAIFISVQQKSKENSILILDEPECHLHPKALVSFVKLLTKSSLFKEIWIATHSIFLVPEFEFENIVYISNSNVVKRTSLMYKNVLSEMLAPNNDINAFFSSLDLWQYCEFIAECFKSPTVVDIVNPKDEQVQLFIKFLEQKHPLHILDCGGGSGRLGLSLDVAGVKDIIYDIYDKQVYASEKFNVYDDLKNISTKYDCVVMMNFLHEVDPTTWCQLFDQVSNLMEDESYIVLIEVKALTKGEMPNNAGFFVLGKEELEILFHEHRKLFEIAQSTKQKSTCLVIPKKCLHNISPNRIYNAIENLKKRAKVELSLMKNGDDLIDKPSYTNARQYAFWSQQYINAIFFLEDKSIIKWSTSSAKKCNNMNIHSNTIKETSGLPNISLDEISKVIDSFKLKYNYMNINFSSFKTIIACFNSSFVPEKQIRTCWEIILRLEKEHVDKTIISYLLLSLSLIGDTRSRNRFINNGYGKYITESESAIRN